MKTKKINYLELNRKKKLLKMVNNHLDKIVTTSKSIAKDWDKKTIPLTTLKVIIEKLKLSITGIKENDLFINDFNNILNTLYSDLEKIAVKMDSKSIPVAKIEEGVRIAKTSFMKELIKNK